MKIKKMRESVRASGEFVRVKKKASLFGQRETPEHSRHIENGVNEIIKRTILTRNGHDDAYETDSRRREKTASTTLMGTERVPNKEKKHLLRNTRIT